MDVVYDTESVAICAVTRVSICAGGADKLYKMLIVVGNTA